MPQRRLDVARRRTWVLQSEELRPLLERFYRGSESSAEERIKLFNLIWDAIGTEFGGRHELYERNYSGNHEQMRVDLLSLAKRRGLLDNFTTFVDRCLAEYGAEGWRSDTWTWEEPEERAHPGKA